MARTPKPEGCNACPLQPIGEGFVRISLPSDYDNVKLLVQGEAPTRDDADESIPFVGKPGHWIRKNILANAGLAEGQVIFDNTLRCLPPTNKKGEHYPIGEVKALAEQHCRQYDVWEQTPKSIPLLLVGGKALAQRTGRESISEWHGHIEMIEGRLTGATFHPAAVMRQPNLLPVAIRETANLLEAARNPAVLRRPEVVKGNVPYLQKPEVVVDLEWNPGTQELTVVGVAYERDRAYSTYHVSEGLEVVRQHFADGRRVIGHNFIKADLPRIGALPKTWGPEHIIDTMVVGHLVHSHLAELGLLDLGSLTRYYEPTSNWKTEKGDLLLYNGLDNAYNYRLWKGIERDLTLTDQWHLVEKQQKLARMSALMQEQGIRIDKDAIVAFHSDWREQRSTAASGFPFNPNSPKQVKAYFEERGVRLNDTSYDTIVKAAKRSKEGSEVRETLDKLVEYKDAGKSLRTWFNEEAESRGYIYPEFKETGTDVARFSCSGPNCQNIPPHLRHIITPRDPELILAAFDGSQIENRTVAWIADEKAMLAAFASGADFHRLNAANIQSMLQGIRVTPEMVTKEQRQQGKTVTHATDYKETPFNLARRLFGNTKREALDKAKALQGAFFKAYPRIREWHSELEKQFERGEVMLRSPFGRARMVYAPDAHEFAKRASHFLGCSSAADIINSAAIQIWEQLGLLPILIVHDELVYELPRGEEGRKLAVQIKSIMEEPVSEMGGLVIPAVAKFGVNYGTLKEAVEPNELEKVFYAAA